MELCLIENCNNVKLCRRLCAKHYNQKKSLGLLNDFPKEMGIISTCKVVDCAKKHLAGGYCTKHYQRLKSRNSLIIKKELFHQCSYKQCDKIIPQTRTYCFNCYHNLKEQQYQYQPKKRFDVSKKNAKKRDLIFDLSFKEYVELILQPCFYCKNSYINCGVGLDRLDNSKGYIKNNVVSCCKFCNKLRGELITPEETKQLIELLKKIRGIDNIWNINFTE